VQQQFVMMELIVTPRIEVELVLTMGGWLFGLQVISIQIHLILHPHQTYLIMELAQPQFVEMGLLATPRIEVVHVRIMVGLQCGSEPVHFLLICWK